MTFFGFMHGEAVGFGVSPGVAAAYVAVAGFLYACARLDLVEAARPPEPAPDPAIQPAE